MENLYRSQCGEDRWIEANYASLGLPERGFFVEFGSGDGERFSNTYWLQHARGWNGLLVEGDPRNKGSREGVDFVRAVIGNGGTASFGMHPTDGDLSGVLRDAVSRITIKTIALSDLLLERRVERVDFISIDTEGTELECWRTLDLSIWHPRIAIIELVTFQLPDLSNQVITCMRDGGYHMIHRTALNGIFRWDGPAG